MPNKMSKAYRNYVIKGKTYETEIIFSPRKTSRTITFRPLPEGEAMARITVRPGTSMASIDAAAAKILPKLNYASVKKSPFDGDSVFLFGKISPNPFSKDPATFYKDVEATLMEYVLPRVRFYENLMGLGISHRVRVKYTKTMLGCHYPKKNQISFSSYLVHFAPSVIDSVVVHELCHYKYHNHGAGFHRMLLKYYPDYANARKCLLKRYYDGRLMGGPDGNDSKL